MHFQLRITEKLVTGAVPVAVLSQITVLMEVKMLKNGLRCKNRTEIAL